MYKLLIVDDEYLVREGLRTTLDWQSLGVEVIATAENGAAGLAKARELKPDLIIADVRMPVMDGLEMAKILFDERADTAVIICSGYKDFENARRALDSGVAGFLLKPVENSELISKVKETLNSLAENRRKVRMLGQFINSLPMVRKEQFALLLGGGEKSEAAAEQLLLLGVCPPQAGTLVYVRSESPQLKTFISSIESSLSDCNCVSEVFSGFAVVLCSADECVAEKRLAALLDGNLKSSDARYTVALSAYDGDIPSAFKKAKTLGENALFTAINAVISGAGGNKYKKIVRDALNIIERDYNKKISIKTVADALYSSESHIMHEFKSQTGKTFNECLTDYRMLKAEELLTKGELRVSEVAYAVGYSDVRYFGQIFKEYYGCTPSEYAERKK